MRVHRPRPTIRGMNRTPAAALLAALLLAACTASPSPTPTPIPSPDPTDLPTATPAPTSSPTVEPSPTATPLAPTVAFRAATVPASELSAAITSILPGGDGLVAIGFDGRFGTSVWTSTDGREWRDVTTADLSSIGLAGVIRASDGRLIGVGRGNTLDVDADAAAAYVSDDGIDWRPATGADGLRGQMISVVETADGFLAVGGVPGADSAGLWRSPDGEAWERIGSDVPSAFFWSIAEGGPGLVVVGWRRNPEPDVAVWTSSDGGATLELADDPEQATLAEATDVVATDSGRLIMVGGSMLGGQAHIWTSDDGIGWELAEVDGGLEDALVRSVIATPIGHVAVGAIGTDAAAWRSTDDGLTWEPFGEPVRDAYFNDVAATDAGLFLFGATQTGTQETGIDSRSAIWFADLED
jgi:hypothetical protein